MAWIKIKSAVVIGAGLLVVAGITTATAQEIQNSSSDALWDNGISDLSIKPPIVKIIPTKFPNRGAVIFGISNPGSTTNVYDSIRLYDMGVPLQTIVQRAYKGSDTRTIYLTALPQGQFDYIANLPSGANEALRQKIKNQFGIVARFTTIETNVFFLKVQSTNAPGLKLSPARNRPIRPSATTGTAVASPATGADAPKGPVFSQNIVGFVNAPQTASDSQTEQFHKTCQISLLANFLENQVKIPVIDQTQLTNRFNIVLDWDKNDPQHEKLKQALGDQLGLEMVPGTAPVEMLVVEKVK